MVPYTDSFKMWMWILITSSFITEVRGFGMGDIGQSCESMLPLHDINHMIIPPQTGEAPFMMTHSPVQNGHPITVSLKSKIPGEVFQGFLLEARERDKVNNGHPVGKFILLDSSKVTHQQCSGIPDAAVRQTANHDKTLIQVNWTANGAGQDITFRATFVKSYSIYWAPLDLNLTIPVTPTSTTEPSTATSTTEPSTATSTTEPSTATSTTNPSTATNTTEPSTATSTTEPSTATSTTEPSTVKSATNPSTASPEPYKITNTTKKVAITLMVVDSFSEILKMVFTSLSSHCTPTLNKVLKIWASVFCAAGEMGALVLIHIGNFYDVRLSVFVYMVIVTDLIEIGIVFLPFGPSHELWTRDVTDIGCFVLHMIFTIAAMLFGVLKIDEYGPDTNEHWFLKVLIAYTVWIFLFVICVFIFAVYSQMIGSSRSRGKLSRHREKRRPGAAVTIAMPLIALMGAMIFITAVIIGIFECGET